MVDLTADASRDLRVGLLSEQHTICGNVELATELEAAGTARTFAKGECLMREGDFEDDIFFIIRGSVDIVSSGHQHATRSHRCHVGEMTLLDPGLGRSADVYSCQDGTMAVQVAGDVMRDIGDRYPVFWRNLGRELADRLRERDRFFVRPNDIPIVFIASSGAARSDLDLIAENLRGPTIECRPWTNPNIFRPSHFPLSSLLQQADEADFAIILATPDDIVEKNAMFRGRLKRASARRAARDNVLLEFGLFVGAIDRDRAFVFEKGDVGLPSDMQGLTTVRYKSETELLRQIEMVKSLIEGVGPFVRMKRTRCK